MSLFVIEESKCGRDGKCANVCPANIIEHAGNAIPVPVGDAEQRCIRCGHCMAVCPSGALRLNFMDPEDCVKIDPGSLPGAEQVQHFFSSRRSIRNYKETPVEREKLEEILDMASYAPSGHNGQPLNWLVIGSRSEVRRLAGLTIDWMRKMLAMKPGGLQQLVDDWDKGIDRICRGAPQLIIAHAAESHLAQTDCTIALTYLELAAHSMGLGACWAGFLGAAAAHYPPLAEALDLPEGHRCFGAMMIGYSQYRYRRIPLRNKPAVRWR